MRRILLVVFVAVLLAASFLAAAVAAPNPNGTGQPAAECGDEGATSEPPGFLTDGFATAEAVYAGSDGTPSAAHGSAHAVSQYDVACFQVTSSRPGWRRTAD